MERKSGVLMHVSSLWGDYSCGSFGKEGREFVDFLEESGFSYWQVLPFCLPNEFASPYASLGAFSVNPNFIDLKELHDVGLITREELESARQTEPYTA
ncbi:MAG: 4-alpha-glucanotransferase, partial [Clostridia bacterium]|nr:4-alpha-glucanotransferase [Clostridia bacterium]